MLEVTDLNAYYGKSHILRGVNLKMNQEKLFLYSVEMVLVDLQHVRQLWEKLSQLAL